jgi:hypothetical protein
MDIGILQYGVNGKIRFELKVRRDKILQKPTIPSFHYSRIEASMHASKNTSYIQPVA